MDEESPTLTPGKSKMGLRQSWCSLGVIVQGVWKGKEAKTKIFHNFFLGSIKKSVSL